MINTQKANSEYSALYSACQKTDQLISRQQAITIFLRQPTALLDFSPSAYTPRISRLCCHRRGYKPLMPSI